MQKLSSPAPPRKSKNQRQAIEIFYLDRLPLGHVWAYMMAQNKVAFYGGILLSEGRWPAS